MKNVPKYLERRHYWCGVATNGIWLCYNKKYVVMVNDHYPNKFDFGPDGNSYSINPDAVIRYARSDDKSTDEWNEKYVMGKSREVEILGGTINIWVWMDVYDKTKCEIWFSPYVETHVEFCKKHGFKINRNYKGTFETMLSGLIKMQINS